MIDVGPQERDSVLVGGDLGLGDELLETERHVLGAERLDQAVHAVEMDERDRRAAVLGIDLAGQQVFTDRHRSRAEQVDTLRGRLRRIHEHG